jgi:hypothetical protein
MANEKIEIPIEVKLTEVKELENQIKELKEARKETLPQKGKSKSSGSQAVPTLDGGRSGALFGGKTGGTPGRGKANPLNLKKGLNGVVLKRDLEKMFKDKTGVLESIFDLGSGKKSPIGAITKFASKAAPPIAVALIAIGFVEKVIAVAFGPGGPFDIRLNEFQERTQKLFATAEQAAKRQGFKVARITSYYGSRGGQNTTFSTLDPLARNTQISDRDLNLLSKRVT